MTTLRYKKGYLMMIAEYQTPSIHKHLASHIMISLEKESTWIVDGQNICCRGICIDSDVEHSAVGETGKTLVFLFSEISGYGRSLKNEILKGQKYKIMDTDIVDQVIRELKKQEMNGVYKEDDLLALCKIHNDTYIPYDERIWQILKYLDQVETIAPEIMEELSTLVFLSKSRLAHLFKKETGMSLHSYIAVAKFHKTHVYYMSGMSITDSAIKAGFNSSSHFSATCKRMFGISMRDVYKTIATK